MDHAWGAAGGKVMDTYSEARQSPGIHLALQTRGGGLLFSIPPPFNFF